ncbi:MAG TPA: lytic transglycosylase domain-containing protein, partial [Pyrinomonadaceae bacterium]|nr:lytic transglycosylase domain-containing protein [Pyrinomonadaceae bacterium]
PVPAPSALTTPEPVPMSAVSKSLDGFSTGDPKVDGFIVESGKRHGVDPVLLYAIMHRESSFKKRALSHKGASGLMQLMPATARRFGVANIWDPRENIEGGTRYMRWLLDKFDGDVRLALAGYNAGEGAVMKYGYRVPPYSETQEYVRRITQRYALMRDPATARRAPVVSRVQVARIKVAEQQFTGTLYERDVYAVRMPDGKLRLVSQ